ncbi:MAG: glycosyltransferase, partial [Patescibacteria group bacterium]
YYPFVGGAEVAVKEITDRLLEFEFDLITARLRSDLPSREKIGHVNVYRLGWGTRWDKLWLAFLGGRFGRKLHRNHSYQLVWAIMASFGGLAAQAFKAKETRVPFLLTLQEGDDLPEVEEKARLVKSRFSRIFTSANFVQCISHYLADWAEKMGATCPIEVVPNGVDFEKVTCLAGRQESEKLPASPAGRKVKSEKQIGEKIIITTSRLVKKNGLDDLIKSLNYLDKNIKLWILGMGPAEDNLKKLANDLQLTERVKFFGFVPNPHLFSYLQEADIFIRPSLSE